MSEGSANSAGRAYGGVSVVERDGRRRRQLLDAGLLLFGDTGYRSATVRGLCREAKIADRHFYQYFAGTEDLLLAVYGECMTRLTTETVAAMSQVESGDDVERVAARGLDAFFRVMEDPLLARVVWTEVLGVSPRVEREYLAAMTSFSELMLAHLRGMGVAVEAENDVDPAILATAAVGGISHTAMTWFLSGYAADRKVVVATTARYLASIGGSLASESITGS